MRDYGKNTVPRQRKAEYMREWRRRNHQYRVENNKRTNARMRAALRVAKAHPEEFEKAFVEEMERPA